MLTISVVGYGVSFRAFKNISRPLNAIFYYLAVPEQLAMNLI